MKRESLIPRYEREVFLATSLKALHRKYGQKFLDHYFLPSILEYGIPTQHILLGSGAKAKDLRSKYSPEIQAELEQIGEKLKTIRDDEISSSQEKEYNTLLDNAMKYNLPPPSTQNELYALVRYEALGNLENGVFWSVLPELKKKWKITGTEGFELFGNFMNTNTKNFCSMFPELEGCGCQFGTFDPLELCSETKFPKKEYSLDKNEYSFLINPVFEYGYLLWTCERVLEWLEAIQKQKTKGLKTFGPGNEVSKTSFTFYIILPVWDKPSQKKLGISLPYKPSLLDVKIGELLSLERSSKNRQFGPKLLKHTMTRMKFYDFVKDVEVPQKSFIHTIVLKL